MDNVCSAAWITGIAVQHPPHELRPDNLETLAAKFYDIKKPGLAKLLAINRATGIDSRRVIQFHEDDIGLVTSPLPPSIRDMDDAFRHVGVDLAVKACRQAIHEWGGSSSDITHTVAVTCTNAGSPGYDMLVVQELGLTSDIDRMLLQGVGCAGGLAALRAAQSLATCQSALGRPARILVFACELCSLNLRKELDAAESVQNLNDLGVAATLFGDAAAAFVICNECDPKAEEKGIYKLIDSGTMCIPGTLDLMSYLIDPAGFRTTLTKKMVAHLSEAVGPMLNKLVAPFEQQAHQLSIDAKSFDWALHPGGKAIISGVQETMNLSDSQLRATKELYRTRGNISSVSVIAVLDLLRNMGRGQDNVIATAFGPGLTVEMAMLQRCRVGRTMSAKEGFNST